MFVGARPWQILHTAAQPQSALGAPVSVILEPEEDAVTIRGLLPQWRKMNSANTRLAAVIALDMASVRLAELVEAYPENDRDWGRHITRERLIELVKSFIDLLLSEPVRSRVEKRKLAEEINNGIDPILMDGWFPEHLPFLFFLAGLNRLLWEYLDGEGDKTPKDWHAESAVYSIASSISPRREAAFAYHEDPLPNTADLMLVYDAEWIPEEITMNEFLYLKGLSIQNWIHLWWGDYLHATSVKGTIQY